MTREEAIRYLGVHSSTNGSGLCTDKQHYEAKQMAIKVLEQQPCEDATLKDIFCMGCEYKEQESKTWSLDDAREDFMHDVYNTLDFLPTNDEANWIIDSFDRVTSSIKQQPCEVEAAKLQQAYNKGFEDCRQAVLDIDFNRIIHTTAKPVEMIKQKVEQLPPVKPQDCDTCEVGNPCLYCKHEFEEIPTGSESEG